MKPCQYVYLATQMTKGIVKITNILLQCDCTQLQRYCTAGLCCQSASKDLDSMTRRACRREHIDRSTREDSGKGRGVPTRL